MNGGLFGYQAMEESIGDEALTLAYSWPDYPRAAIIGLNAVPASDAARHSYRCQTGRRQGSTPFVYVNKIGYISRDQLECNEVRVDEWKVVIPKAGDGHGRVPDCVLGEPIAIAHGLARTQKYIAADTFHTRDKTENCGSCRFLVLQHEISQDLTPLRFGLVPALDWTRRWADADLYNLFRFTDEGTANVGRVIAPRDPILSLDSPISDTHLPGGRKYQAGDGPADLDDHEDDQ